MENWSDFFTAAMGAAAALSGTLLVAISINIERILAQPTLPVRAANTLVLVGSALMVSSFGLLPFHSLPPLGWLTSAAGVVVLISGVQVLRAVIRHRSPAVQGARVIIGLIGPLAAILLYAIGGAQLLAADPAGLYWTGAGVLLSFVVALENSWVLLVEILR